MKTRKNKFPHMMNMEEMQVYRDKCDNHTGANFSSKSTVPLRNME